MNGLSCGEESMTICSAVLIQYQRVTDRQTDGQTDVQPIAKTCFSIADARKSGTVQYRKLYRTQWLTQTHAGHSIAFNIFLHFVTLWLLTPKTIPLVGYLKFIPYTKFEDFEIIRFWVMLRTDIQAHRYTQLQAHTDAAKRFTPATVVGVSNKPHAYIYAYVRYILNLNLNLRFRYRSNRTYPATIRGEPPGDPIPPVPLGLLILSSAGYKF